MSQTKSFDIPVWLVKDSVCKNCESPLEKTNMLEFGFYTYPKKAGTLFARFYCPQCNTTNVVDYCKDESWTIEKICKRLLVEQSTVDLAEKIKLLRQ